MQALDGWRLLRMLRFRRDTPTETESVSDFRDPPWILDHPGIV